MREKVQRLTGQENGRERAKRMEAGCLCYGMVMDCMANALAGATFFIIFLFMKPALFANFYPSPFSAVACTCFPTGGSSMVFFSCDFF